MKFTAYVYVDIIIITASTYSVDALKYKNVYNLLFYRLYHQMLAWVMDGRTCLAIDHCGSVSASAVCFSYHRDWWAHV